MGGSRSCQRQTCTASRTDSGLAVLAFALRLVPRCRANLAPQAVFHNSSAAVSVPFRRLSTHSPGWRFPTLRIGRPNLDLRSRLGLPVPNPKSLSVLLPTQAFCIPLTRQHLPTHNQCKFPIHRTEPPSHPTAQASPRQRAQPCSPFALASPQPPTRRARARLSASLAPEVACFAHKLFSAGSESLKFDASFP